MVAGLVVLCALRRASSSLPTCVVSALCVTRTSLECAPGIDIQILKLGNISLAARSEPAAPVGLRKVKIVGAAFEQVDHANHAHSSDVVAAWAAMVVGLGEGGLVEVRALPTTFTQSANMGLSGR